MYFFSDPKCVFVAFYHLFIHSFIHTRVVSMEKEFGIRCYRPITLPRKSALNIIAGHLRGEKRESVQAYTRVCLTVYAAVCAPWHRHVFEIESQAHNYGTRALHA